MGDGADMALERAFAEMEAFDDWDSNGRNHHDGYEHGFVDERGHIIDKPSSGPWPAYRHAKGETAQWEGQMRSYSHKTIDYESRLELVADTIHDADINDIPKGAGSKFKARKKVKKQPKLDEFGGIIDGY